MLSPVSLRICWVAAMAPALTEAASQVDNFALPNSPATKDFSSLPLNIGSQGKQSKLSDISQSFATLTQIGAKSSNYSKLKNKLTENCLNEKELSLLPWTGINQSLQNHRERTENNLNNFVCNGKSGTNVILRTPCRLNDILPLHGLKDQCQNIFSKQTMNENPIRIEETMGLINANTSLDCELKGKLLDGSQPTDLGQEPFLMTPEDTRLQIDDVDSKTPPAIEDSVSVPSDSSVLTNGASVGMHSISTQVQKVISSSSMTSRNVTLRRRALHLITRIRRLQVRQSEWHIKGQLKAFVEHQQNNLGIPCLHKSDNFGRIQNSEELLHSEDVKNLSTAALVSLVRKLESSQHGKLHPFGVFQDTEKVEVRISPDECQTIKQTAVKLHNNLNYLERTVDSDATESSSADDSGPEEQEFDVQNPPTASSGRKRAPWRLAVDRAAVASRWIWLQTQVSDLEYRIRQQTETHKRLRLHKGVVSLLDQTSVIGTNAVEERLVAGTDKRPTNKNFSSFYGTKVVNGFRSSDSIGNGYTSTDKIDDGRGEVECSRTRPLKPFRKRKLVRTMGLHLTNRKASRLTAVKCSCNCQRDLLPCIICGGRYNSVQTLDPDTMPLTDRIALLDTSFHPVLSFKQDACLGIRYEKILRKCEFSKSAEKQGLTFRKKRFAISLADQARKHTRKLTRNAAQSLLSSAKLRKSMGTHHRRFPRLDSNDINHRHTGFSNSSLISLKHRGNRVRSCSVSSNGSSKQESPSSSPLPSMLGDAVEVQEQNMLRGQGSSSKVSTLHELLRRRRFENAFDINNIVIPHSIASATRVEKLQYKEILTPKWRIFYEPDTQCATEDVVEEQIEDLCDDTFIFRHLRCEEEEKKKFRSYLTKPGHGRSRLRSGGRMDSRADSSGANTPDPMSPYPADSSSNQEAPYCGWNSPVASPPPTPNPFMLLEEQCLLGSPSVISRERRRTLSLSKRVSEDDNQSFVEKYIAVPYEPRVFPLSEDEYFEMLSNSVHLEDAIQSEVASVTPSVGSEEGANSVSRAQSPGNSSSVGSVPEEDPNDPEWTVITGSKSRNPSIFLKLAKR